MTEARWTQRRIAEIEEIFKESWNNEVASERFDRQQHVPMDFHGYVSDYAMYAAAVVSHATLLESTRVANVKI